MYTKEYNAHVKPLSKSDFKQTLLGENLLEEGYANNSEGKTYRYAQLVRPDGPTLVSAQSVVVEFAAEEREAS